MAGNIGKLVAEVGLDTANMDKGLKGLKDKVKVVGAAFTAMGAVGAVAIGKSIKTFADFELAITKAGVVSDATAKQMTQMSDVAKELGRTTAFSATQAAEALTFLAMAGFSVQEATSALPGVLQLAAAAGLELGQAADITSNVLAGFGMQVEDIGKVNDVMAKAMTSANTDLVQLAQALKFAGPVAAAAGISFEETTAALALMGNAGIQASMAGTGLRGAMTRLLTPTGAAGKIIDKLGVTLHDTQGNLLPLITIVQEFERVGLSAGDAMTIFGQRAGPAMLALISQGSGALVTLTDELRNSGGTAKKIADAQMATFQGSMLKLKSAVEGVQIALGEQFAPTIQKVAGLITKVVSAIADINPTVLKIVAVMGGLAVAFALIAGPALLIVGFLPTLGVGFTILAGALGLSGTAAGGASIGFGALALSMLPILIGVAAVAAAIAAGILIWKNWDKIILVLKATFTVVSSALAKIFDSKWAWLLPGGALIKAILFVKRNWKAIWDGVLGVYQRVSDAVKAAFTSKWGWLLPGGVFIKSLLFLKENWDRIWGAIVTGFQKTAEIMSAILGPLKGLFGDIESEIIKLETAANSADLAFRGLADDSAELGESIEATQFKVASMILEVDQLGNSMETAATGTARLSANTEELGKIEEATNLAIIASHKLLWDRKEALDATNLVIEEQQFRLEHLSRVTIDSTDIMAQYEQGQITLEQAIFVLEQRLKNQQAEFAATAREVSAAEAKIESNRQAWDRWEFQQSDVIQTLVESKATWAEMMQGIAASTGLSLEQVKEQLISAGVGINDLAGLAEEFGTDWVAAFVKAREGTSIEVTGMLGEIARLREAIANPHGPTEKGQRNSELGRIGKINALLGSAQKTIIHLRNKIGKGTTSTNPGAIASDERAREAFRRQIEELKRGIKAVNQNREGIISGELSLQKIFREARELDQGGIVTSPTLAKIGETGPEVVIPLNRGGSIQEIIRTFNASIGSGQVISGSDIPSIPSLAAGAVVTAPTLAMIGEAGSEAVFPLDQFGGGRQEIIVMLDSEVIGRAVGNSQVEMIRVKTGIRS